MTGRLLILTLYYPPDLSAGAFRAKALVDALRAHAPDLEIDVITGTPSRYHSFATTAPERETDGRLTIRRIAVPAHRSDMRTQAFSYARFARRAASAAREKRYDLICATSSRLLTATLGAWVSRRSGSPLYLDIRDLFVDTMNDVLSSRVAPVVRPALSAIERWTIPRASKVNLVSPGFEPYFQRRYPAMPLSFFTNGIDDDFLMPSKSAGKNAGDPMTVTYAGNMGEGQGLHLIVPAVAARLANRARFRLIGDGGRKTALADGVRAAGLSNVTLLPPMSRVDLISEYQAADVLFLHLNAYDAFTRVLPSKVFEYAALGKPIWAGVAGFSADFIRAEVDNAAVFPPCNAERAIEALDTLRLESTPRDAFIRRYARSDIMQRLAADILGQMPTKSHR
jgi:glycosyltransferase involved in cell wall biosynthesis